MKYLTQNSDSNSHSNSDSEEEQAANAAFSVSHKLDPINVTAYSSPDNPASESILAVSPKPSMGTLIDRGFSLDKQIKTLNQKVENAKLASKYEADNQEQRLLQLRQEWTEAAQIVAEELLSIAERRSETKVTMGKMLKSIHINPRVVFPQGYGDENEDEDDDDDGDGGQPQKEHNDSN